MASNYFTPIFIVVVLCICVGGVAILQVFDRMFAGSEFQNTVRMFGIAIILNIIMLAFLIMSFGKIKFEPGPKGPRGNRGLQGNEGDEGKLSVCGDHTLTVSDVRKKTRDSQNLDLQKPYIMPD
jgi:hypothetical protein